MLKAFNTNSSKYVIEESLNINTIQEGTFHHAQPVQFMMQKQ